MASFNIPKFLQLQTFLANGSHALWYFLASPGSNENLLSRAYHTKTNVSLYTISLVLWTLSMAHSSVFPFSPLILLFLTDPITVCPHFSPVSFPILLLQIPLQLHKIIHSYLYPCILLRKHKKTTKWTTVTLDLVSASKWET